MDTDDAITGAITGASSVQVIPFGSKGARALVFPTGMAVVLRTPADCDAVIKAAALAKKDIPVDHWPVYYGRALAGNPDGAA